MGFDIGGIVLRSPGTTLSVDANTTTFMRVNANGILTRPQTPYMRGQLTGLAANVSGYPLKVTANDSVGNCWNNASGLWTCPIDGHYLACAFNIAGNGPSSGYFYLMKNGAVQRYTHWNHASSWHNVSLSGIVLCAAGDTIGWQVANQSPAAAGFYGAGGHCMYSIALMV